MFRFIKPGAIGLAALPFFVFSASAQTPLPEVVISANQVPQEADRVGASVTVLKGDELRARGVETVVDALRTVPGVHVSQSGSKGSLSQVRIRGAEANHLQVIIDDVPVGRLDGGDFDFADLLIDDIERIEVLRGPQSGIYGGNAQSGVISIYTKSGRGLKKPEAEIRVEGGTQQSQRTSASIRNAIGSAYGAITFQHRDTNGFNISRFGNERDGHRAFVFNGKAGIDISEYLNIEGVLRHTDRKVQYDPEIAVPLPDAFALDKNQHTNARINATTRSFDGMFVQRFGVFARTEDFTSACPTCFTTFRATAAEAVGGDYKGSLRYAAASIAHTSTVLIDYREEKFTSGVTANRERTGIAYEHIADLPFGLTLSGALRHDFHDVFQDATTWRLAASQKFNTGTRIHTSTGTGITLPTFFEQFGFGLTFIGNPNLKPEKSIGWDFGVEQTFWNGLVVADITYFAIDAEDAIRNAGTTAFNDFGTSRRRGVEFTGKLNPWNWLAFEATYTYTDAETTTGVEEIRRPKNAGSFTTIFRAPDNKTRASITVIHNGKMADDAFIGFPATRVSLDSYTLVNAIITHQLTPSTQLYIRGENLLNDKYEEVFSYRSPGATGYIGLRMKLGDITQSIQ